MRLCELREKEVINICDCKRLGHVIDIDFNPETGQIYQLIIPSPTKFCGFFGHDSEYIIWWKSVRQIGKDIILVEVPPEEDHPKKSCNASN